MQDFLNYLTSKNITKLSLKNYKSDISHFTSWLIMKLRTMGSYVENLESTFPFITPTVVKNYIAYMTENKAPRKTINRRLSSLRNLAKYLLEIKFSESDFMFGIENIKDQSVSNNNSILPIVEDFKQFLEAEKASAATIKNYTSDVKQFMSWLENAHYAQTT